MLNITDVDAFSTVQHIADGDALNGTNHAAEMQTVANRTKFLAARVMATVANDPIMFPILAMLPDPTATNGWAFGSAGTALALNQYGAASPYAVFLEIQAPKFGFLQDIGVTLAGATGHGGMPGTMPKITLYRQDPGSVGAPTTVGTATDSTAGVPAYELAHSVTITGINESLEHDGGSRFYLKLEGESGANAISGLALLSIFGHVSPS